MPLLNFSESRQLDHVLGVFFPSLGLVRFNFDWRKYSHIDEPIANNKKLVEEYGTLFHEIYHYIQTVSTPYCYYLFLLEYLKFWAYSSIIQCLPPRFFVNGLKIPFWAYMNQPGVFPKLEEHEKQHLDVLFQFGNSAHIVQEVAHKGIRIKNVTSEMISSVSRFVEEGLGTLADVNRSGSIPPALSKYFKYFLGMPETKHLFPHDDTGIQISGWMIMEGAAFVISTYPFWHKEIKNRTPLVLETTQHFGNAFYCRLIEFTARALDISDASTLKNTFLAIADLSLHIPINENNDEGTASINWLDFHPGWRFVRILDFARSLPPIQSYEKDYIPFIEKVCDKFKWKTPMTIAAIVSNITSQVDLTAMNWLESEFTKALKEKEKKPWMFFDPEDELFVANDWIKGYIPPFVEGKVNGTVTLTKPKEQINKIVDWYIKICLPEQLLLRPNINVFLPGFSEAAIAHMVKGKLRQYGVELDTLSTLPKEDIERGYNNYSKRKKYYGKSNSFHWRPI